jgi:glycerol uptake facilitator protein
MALDLGRRLLAKAIGTALLVVFGAGAVLAALTIGKGKLDFAGLGVIAISFALVIAVAEGGRFQETGGDIGRARE